MSSPQPPIRDGGRSAAGSPSNRDGTGNVPSDSIHRLVVLGYITAIAMPPIGLILGLVLALRLNKPDSRRATSIIVLSIVAAIVWSKRRASSLGDEAPADTEIAGATAPAVSAEPAVPAELTEKQADAINDVPLGHAPEEASLNGQVSSGSPKQAETE